MAAIDEHLERRVPLVAVPTARAGIDDPRPEDLADVGVTARVLKAVRLGDGTAQVLLEGEQRVHVGATRMTPEFGGILAAFRPIHEHVESADQVDLLVARLREELKNLVQTDSRLHGAFVRLSELPTSPGRLADQVAANLTLSQPDRLAILAEGSVDRRLRIVLRTVIRELELRKLGADIQKDVQDTMDKQQREYYLREHIRALQKELGEVSKRLDDADELEKRLKEAGMAEASLDEALRELDRMRRTSSTPPRCWMPTTTGSTR
jgi:ATP-dependent Lon protease